MVKGFKATAVMASLLLVSAGASGLLANCTQNGEPFPVFQCGFVSWFAPPPAGAVQGLGTLDARTAFTTAAGTTVNLGGVSVAGSISIGGSACGPRLDAGSDAGPCPRTAGWRRRPVPNRMRKPSG